MIHTPFTPGPWGFLERSVYDGRQVRIAVAEWRGVGGTAIGVANAQLMASAPDLLRALKLIEWSGVHDGTLGSCPSCGKHRTEGHREDCPIGTAIVNAEGK